MRGLKIDKTSTEQVTIFRHHLTIIRFLKEYEYHSRAAKTYGFCSESSVYIKTSALSSEIITELTE